MIIRINENLHSITKPSFEKYVKIYNILDKLCDQFRNGGNTVYYILPESCSPPLFIKLLQFIETCNINISKFSLDDQIELYKMAQKYDVENALLLIRGSIIEKLSNESVLLNDECGSIISNVTYLKLMKLYSYLYSVRIYVMFVISYNERSVTTVLCSSIPEINFKVIPSGLSNKRMITYDEFTGITIDLQNLSQCPSCGHVYIGSNEAGHYSKCGHMYYPHHCKKCTDKHLDKCKFCKSEVNNVCPISQKVIKNPFKLKCSHVFEKHCVLEWLANSDVCPVCKV